MLWSHQREKCTSQNTLIALPQAIVHLAYTRHLNQTLSIVKDFLINSQPEKSSGNLMGTLGNLLEATDPVQRNSYEEVILNRFPNLWNSQQGNNSRYQGEFVFRKYPKLQTDQFMVFIPKRTLSSPTPSKTS